MCWSKLFAYTLINSTCTQTQNTHVPSTVCTFQLTPSQPLPLKVHRRCLYDDGRGVGEPLNETGQFGDGLIIRGKHVVLLDNIENSTVYHRIVAEALMMEPVHGVQPSTDSPSDYVQKYYTNVSQCTVCTYQCCFSLMFGLVI